ncbi:hypothetical protein LOK49_LG12G02498 [Camellia lanceoleosa]|uniref:Uncharacterized protein n=1 Tax=Camellia lanceoleosa TaxID=1840588 RepID=A0ACC0FNF2_9ERIC|nr:hypothetical protein LOK49_LG12G02498 [Camellia lanceoleosa]
MIGDFNQVLYSYEKHSKVGRPIQGAKVLMNFINDHGFVDLPSSGVRFTWSNNRRGPDVSYEKLDRAVAASGWMQQFRHVVLLALPIQRLDHSPLILDTNPVPR